MTSATAASTATLATLLPSWECDSNGGGASSKYSPIKVEPIEEIVLAELKPPIYDYESSPQAAALGTTSLTGIDSVLTAVTATANNNSKSVTDLNLSSPGQAGAGSTFSSSASTASSTDVTSSGSPTAAVVPTGAAPQTTLTPPVNPSQQQQTGNGGGNGGAGTVNIDFRFGH